MRRVHTKRELRATLAMSREKRRVLVPTMGALHAGHAELLRRAREIAGNSGIVVASVFLNPTQFDRVADLAGYPQHPGEDTQLCEDCGVDVLFMPRAEEMYCADRSVQVEETELSRVLCGVGRPGHFAGVCLVVSKLFNLIQPTDAVFGKKDYQQLAVLRRLVRDLDYSVTLYAVPIVREKDGLAVSSRNERLTPPMRALAPKLYAALQSAKNAYLAGQTTGVVCAEIIRTLEQDDGVRAEYVRMVNPDNLAELDEHSTLRLPALLAAAVWYGNVRLIDNIELTE